MRKLLAATSNEFLPSIVLGAFAGLRSAEIKRLTWDDIRLAERHIVVGKDKVKDGKPPDRSHLGELRHLARSIRWACRGFVGWRLLPVLRLSRNARPKKPGSPGSATGYATAMPAIALPRQWTPDAWRVSWVTAQSSFIGTTASWLPRKGGKSGLLSSQATKRVTLSVLWVRVTLLDCKLALASHWVVMADGMKPCKVCGKTVSPNAATCPDGRIMQRSPSKARRTGECGLGWEPCKVCGKTVSLNAKTVSALRG